MLRWITRIVDGALAVATALTITLCAWAPAYAQTGITDCDDGVSCTSCAKSCVARGGVCPPCSCSGLTGGKICAGTG
jgi:hypothetical protein